MKSSSRPPRAPSRLPDSLHHKLNMYAFAASAAGVSLLALAQPSQAKIVYTRTHQVIGTNGVYPLDLNHDETIDFLIKERGCPFSQTGYNALGVKEAFGNAVEGSRFLASALRKGAPIGSRRRFITNTFYFGEVMVAAGCSAELGCSTTGQWQNINNRYLGLKFQIDGKTHYAWARLSVEFNLQQHKITATLSGYAYETVPNRGIHAGQTLSQADDVATSRDSSQSETPVATPLSPVSQALRPASLGRLALGNSGVPLRRQPWQ